MIIKLGDFADSHVQLLITYHQRGMHANSPPGQCFVLDWSSLQKPEISFYTGWMADTLVVMGALKALGDGTGELKSMRVAEGHAGKGYGEALLKFLIAEAKQRGYSRLSLETGSTPAFEPALALYCKHGFVDGEPFGDYVKSDFNRLMHLTLSNKPHQ